jgi:hypothetical protein
METYKRCMTLDVPLTTSITSGNKGQHPWTNSPGAGRVCGHLDHSVTGGQQRALPRRPARTDPFNSAYHQGGQSQCTVPINRTRGHQGWERLQGSAFCRWEDKGPEGEDHWSELVTGIGPDLKPGPLLPFSTCPFSHISELLLWRRLTI